MHPTPRPTACAAVQRTGSPPRTSPPAGAPLRSVLSYFSSYFSPGTAAPLSNRSTGQIAAHLHETLARRGRVIYVGENPVGGLDADLFVGHFWAFAEFCRLNRFARKVVVYPVADPAWTRHMLTPLAEQFAVPMPDWDLPPSSFDHEQTMELADLVLVVGNDAVLATFPERWRSKIRMLNYSVDPRVLDPEPRVTAGPEFCYIATWCDLRKGFMDVLETWSGAERPPCRLHVVGGLKQPWQERMAEHASDRLLYHGWLDSHSTAYRSLVRSCRYAHIPTYSEGQMGTLLEVVSQGCIPVTTPISGVDERVLEHCLVVQPRDIDGQRAAIAEALSWSTEEYLRRRDALLDAVRRAHTWPGFHAGVTAALDEVA